MVRTERRHDPPPGDTHRWRAASTAMVNQFYVYAVDDDFGPFFLKFCSYSLQRQAVHQRARVPEAAADEAGCRVRVARQRHPALLGPRTPAAPGRPVDGEEGRRAAAQVAGPPAHPFTVSDRQQGIRYDVSILRAEFALTQVFDRPAQGRVFFEEAVRENLDMGRPDHVQLIFDRRVSRRTPSRYRTRVITDGVIPSLHVPPDSSSTSCLPSVAGILRQRCSPGSRSGEAMRAMNR